MKKLFEKITEELEKQRDLVLVTLIETDGSTPRKTGAQMLCGESGRIFGTIGGGWLEGISIEIAQNVLTKKQSLVQNFVLDDKNLEKMGMICGGKVTALFQYISGTDTSANRWGFFLNALKLAEENKGGWLVQSLSGGRPSLLDEKGNLICGARTNEKIPEKPICFRNDDTFWQPIPVQARAVIFGGGHIAAALVPLLETIDFQCWVFDDRPHFVTEKRFPTAEKLIYGDYTKIADYLTMTTDDYAVIMTNGHSHDLEIQDQVLRGSFAYIGVVGSARKTAAVNAALRERGIPEEKIAQVHTPIGTAIKAVTPEEIAVSIAGELILTRALRRGK